MGNKNVEIATLRSIKYSEISIRRFNALDRTKNLAAFELKIAEDGEIFSAIDVAGTTSAQTTNMSSNTTRAGLAAAFAQIEGRRLAVGNILINNVSGNLAISVELQTGYAVDNAEQRLGLRTVQECVTTIRQAL